ncbi:asparagine synthase (glutamine-hydrolyzing) [candidate division KSB3 bacterium]|uniref:asparagine synthase (glutamine-hydrolyzing) n=1 Tax=candidate division KSB3 bacterium TaxID=2044937 RepID=A0A2G6K8F0_9BACT|nr:MAG: asparagine synthase (glutamine-hydrolyzing) [candidate division KSB3 bacterium]
MCGILGAISKNRIQGDPVENALHLLRHRGPDDRGLYTSPHAHLGHTRLSILDLSRSGHQPMSYANERFWITFNGEIYNYIELRVQLTQLGYRFKSHTDTEVLLAAYAEWGKACLAKLRGMFAFGIWDTRKQHLFLARDRLGEKPLLYWQNRQTFYFASEFKALLALLPGTPELDPTALEQYLYYQYVPEPSTPLSGIAKLPPAHYMIVQKNSWQNTPERYWSLEGTNSVEGNPEALIRQELDNVIELTLRSDVPVGISLSGGLDSGGIASLAVQKYHDTLKAFSLGYQGIPAYDERHQARQLAHALQIPFWDIEVESRHVVQHFPELVYALDEPIADIAAYGYYRVMQKAAEHGMKVMLNGFGGDELFWGYPWVVQAVQSTIQKYRVLHKKPFPQWLWKAITSLIKSTTYRQAASLKLLPTWIRLFLEKGKGIRSLHLEHPRQAIFYDLVPGFQEARCYTGLFSSDARAMIAERAPQRVFDIDLSDENEIPRQICQLLFDTWLTSNCINLLDRLSMVNSIEARLPLVDYKLIELVTGLRKVHPDHDLEYKAWLKSALAGKVPDTLLSRQKQGFQPPTQLWMEAILSQYIHVLLSGYLRQQHLFSEDYLHKMVKEFRESQRHTFILYKLVLLEIWYGQIVMGEMV